VHGLRLEFGPQSAGSHPGGPRNTQRLGFGEPVEVRHVPPSLDEEVPGKTPTPMTDDAKVVGPDHRPHQWPGTPVLGTDRTWLRHGRRVAVAERCIEDGADRWPGA